MTQYGSFDYWDNRYEEESENLFDWLVDYKDVDKLLNELIADKTKLILLPGCGNAPFTPDLYHSGGYKNLINFDTSEVVISQMKNKFPEIHWEVMNVLSLRFKNNEIPYIIDKSLIDTLLCYKDG